jgi:hypothetical protein
MRHRSTARIASRRRVSRSTQVQHRRHAARTHAASRIAHASAARTRHRTHRHRSIGRRRYRVDRKTASRHRDRVNAPQDRVVIAHRTHAIAINDRATAHATHRIAHYEHRSIAHRVNRASRIAHALSHGTSTRIKRTHARARTRHAARIGIAHRKQGSIARTQYASIASTQHRASCIAGTDSKIVQQSISEYRWHRDVIAHAHRARASRDRTAASR